jgi:hypothetical protein
MVVCTDGYILDSFFPYTGVSNDASILEDLLKTEDSFLNLVQENKCCLILDRGFVQCRQFLEDMGVECVMPKFLNKKKRKQFSTNKANDSRLVTKVRWVVEAANARLKQWKIFRNQVRNKSLDFLDIDIRIVCAIINKFRGPIKKLAEGDEDCANEMLSRKRQKNILQKKCTAKGEYSSKKTNNWHSFSSETTSFPELSINEMKYSHVWCVPNKPGKKVSS